MGKHIEFDDMVKYINCSRLDADSIKLAQRVNSHLLVCDECKKQFDILNRFQEAVYGAVDVEEYFKESKNWKTLITFEIEKNVRLIVDRVKQSLYYYDYPIPVGVRGDGQAEKSNVSVVVDEENSLNTIKIVDNECIIELDCDEWGEKSPVICIADDEGKIICIEEMNKCGDIYFFRKVLSNAKYKVYIEPKGMMEE